MLEFYDEVQQFDPQPPEPAPKPLTPEQKGDLGRLWEDLQRVGGSHTGNRAQRRAAERVYRKYGLPMPHASEPFGPFV